MVIKSIGEGLKTQDDEPGKQKHFFGTWNILSITNKVNEEGNELKPLKVGLDGNKKERERI